VTGSREPETTTMRHARGVHYLTDPVTGFTCPAIAGAAGDDDDGGADGAGADDGTRDGTGDGDADTSTDGDERTRDGTGKPKASDPEQLRADLAKERKRRQEAEKRAKDLEQQGETDADRIRREAREDALAPARRMARRTAVTDTARTLGFVDGTDAYAALIADGTLDTVEVDDERLEVTDPDAVRDSLVKLAKAKPHLLTDDARAKLEGRSASGTAGSSVDGQGSGSGSKSPDEMFGAILAGGRGRR
jgi:hypothetical protein